MEKEITGDTVTGTVVSPLECRRTLSVGKTVDLDKRSDSKVMP